MDTFESKNARAWDKMVQGRAPLARPATDRDFANPLRTVDPLGWLGESIQGWRVLCLAAGGGRQSALYAAAGADVTVLDISREMLAQDAAVARERKLKLRIVEGTMTDLSMFAAGDFDLVLQPVSSCYVPDVVVVYRQVARLLQGGGLYVSQHKTPASLQVAAKPSSAGYVIDETYYRTAPLPPATEPSRLREVGATEYLHRWEQLIGGLCRAGFVVEDLIEPAHAEADAERGTFAHRAQYIAPYVRIKARRVGERGLIR
ncbi:class I SAM-dependent methyltransferase [Aeoliella mucimassa]|uniref:Ubiquinone biosynthesis O-methyltransferase n=1 Tax=Aeoliella mucimassa TaxID=2527972 RepID=A0A518AI93_9BACT|nr:class I SAM-dependent methyltransferase [Aeoliella mucimassa]QDU54453.1 Ubiquinone biosynthesis O-methyltransferase [Aeoliella mucimassa]